MLTIGLQSDVTSHARAMEGMRRSLAAPLSDSSGIGGGLQEAVNIYAGAMRRRFSAASAGDGTWKPLKPSTIAKKRKLTPWPERILYLTGRLYSSLTPGEPGSVLVIERDRIRYGTNVPYAKYHQRRRPILAPPTQEVIERCTRPIVAAWQKVINANVASSRIAA